MTREEIMQLNTDYLNGCESEHKMNELFGYVLELQKHEKDPKVGNWIEERTYMECPNCHDIWHYEENQTERFKFCPTCGKRFK